MAREPLTVGGNFGSHFGPCGGKRVRWYASGTQIWHLEHMNKRACKSSSFIRRRLAHAVAALVLLLGLLGVSPSVAEATAWCGGRAATITSNDAIVLGTPGRDVIVGGPADQQIMGGGSNDIICGGGGDDQIYGEAGNDILLGQDGDDFLVGGSGSDLIAGGNDNDRLLGGVGNDALFGNRGDDVVNGDAGVDFVFGNQGADNVSGGFDNDGDFVLGGSGNDRLPRPYGPDRLYGQSGDDMLGADPRAALFASGGSGTDTYDPECEEIGSFNGSGVWVVVEVDPSKCMG